MSVRHIEVSFDLVAPGDGSRYALSRVSGRSVLRPTSPPGFLSKSHEIASVVLFGSRGNATEATNSGPSCGSICEDIDPSRDDGTSAPIQNCDKVSASSRRFNLGSSQPSMSFASSGCANVVNAMASATMAGLRFRTVPFAAQQL